MIDAIEMNHVNFSGLQGPQETIMYISLTEQTTFGHKRSRHYLVNIRFNSLFDIIFDH